MGHPPKKPAAAGKSVPQARRQRIMAQLGKGKTAEEVARANGISASMLRGWAWQAKISTASSPQRSKPAPKAAKATKVAARKRAKPAAKAKAGTIVSNPVLRPAISKSCASCAYLMGILREVVVRMSPKALLGGRR